MHNVQFNPSPMSPGVINAPPQIADAQPLTLVVWERLAAIDSCLARLGWAISDLYDQPAPQPPTAPGGNDKSAYVPTVRELLMVLPKRLMEQEHVLTSFHERIRSLNGG